MVGRHVGIQIGLSVLTVRTDREPSGHVHLLSLLEVVYYPTLVTAHLIIGCALLFSRRLAGSHPEGDEFAAVLAVLDFSIGDQMTNGTW